MIMLGNLCAIATLEDRITSPYRDTTAVLEGKTTYATHRDPYIVPQSVCSISFWRLDAPKGAPTPTPNRPNPRINPTRDQCETFMEALAEPLTNLAAKLLRDDGGVCRVRAGGHKMEGFPNFLWVLL